jgi:enoyl-CoA hydratase/carnithine racemase
MSEYEAIVFTVREGIAEIRVNRPAKMNAMDRPMYARIT